MKIKELKPDEEFTFQGHVFTISLEDGKAKFKFVRRHDGKKKTKEFVPPTKTQVMDYFFEKGYESFAGAKAWDYYHELEWKDSRGTPITNWKSKMIANWFKDEIKRKQTVATPQMVR